jgi:uncharacterized protein (TIGR03086 family)
MELHEMMSTAGRSVVEVVNNVKPDQLGAPTPCSDWDVRTLVNHLMFWSAFRSELAARKQTAPEDDPITEQTDFTREPDWATTFQTQLRKATSAWAEPGATDGETGLAGGSMAAPVIGMMMVGELVMHGWDLAVATGQRLEVDEEVVAAVHEATAAMADQGRSYGVFADEVTVPDDASPLDRVLAISGRDPSWRP